MFLKFHFVHFGICTLHLKIQCCVSCLIVGATIRVSLHCFCNVIHSCGMSVLGTNDQVRCFYCGGGLRHWEPGDDPWIEHARWFSQCGYVRLVKGDEFVQLSIEQHPPILPSIVHVSTVVNPRPHFDLDIVGAGKPVCQMFKNINQHIPVKNILG